MYNQNLSIFNSVELLYGREKFQKLAEAHILVVGIGGVGSWSVESLARSGVGKITLVDLDEVCQSNINRQIHALSNTVGKSKVSIMKERIHLINPHCQVIEVCDFFTSSTCDEILDSKNQYTYAIDAIDSLKNKCLLISQCKERGLPLVTTGGAAGKKDPLKIQITDLARSYDDSLLFRVRKKLRADFGFTRSKKRKFGIDCVFSPELVNKNQLGQQCQSDAVPGKRNCDNGLGTISFVTASFGLCAASHVINSIIADPANVS